jgi:hypothetical protein
MAETMSEIADIIIIDCSGPELVATFWATVLGDRLKAERVLTFG